MKAEDVGKELNRRIQELNLTIFDALLRQDKGDSGPFIALTRLTGLAHLGVELAQVSAEMGEVLRTHDAP